MVIQRILRHAHVTTTATYYIKTAAEDARNAMTTLEAHISNTGQTQTATNGTPEAGPASGPSSFNSSVSDWNCRGAGGEGGGSHFGNFGRPTCTLEKGELSRC